MQEHTHIHKALSPCTQFSPWPTDILHVKLWTLYLNSDQEERPDHGSFFNIDVSAYNSFVVWNEINPAWKEGKNYKTRLFLEELGKSNSGAPRSFKLTPSTNVILCYIGERHASNNRFDNQPETEETKERGVSTTVSTKR